MNPKTQKVISILIVDDEGQIRDMLQRAARRKGYACLTAANGEEALYILEKDKVDVVITDINMPKMDGLELTGRIREKYDSDVIMITGYAENIAYEEAIEKGASDFIQKPIRIKELMIRLSRVLRERAMHSELQESLEQMHEVLKGVIHIIASTVEARDPYTSGHQRRVADLACAMAREMGLTKDRITGIRMAGIIHDLGKIAVPSEILSKPGRLSEIEFEILKTHPRVGYDILKKINFPWPIAEIIYQHHERMDGSGYPGGLKDGETLLEARIIAVADVVEAMASHRPYRAALGIDTALEEISKNRGKIYEPDVADACLKVFNEKVFKF